MIHRSHLVIELDDNSLKPWNWPWISCVVLESWAFVLEFSPLFPKHFLVLYFIDWLQYGLSITEFTIQILKKIKRNCSAFLVQFYEIIFLSYKILRYLFYFREHWGFVLIRPIWARDIKQKCLILIASLLMRCRFSVSKSYIEKIILFTAYLCWSSPGSLV